MSEASNTSELEQELNDALDREAEGYVRECVAFFAKKGLPQKADLAALLRKGEDAGHPFRGNQYTGGNVGGDRSRSLSVVPHETGLLVSPSKSVKGTELENVSGSVYEHLSELAAKKGALQEVKISEVYSAQGGVFSDVLEAKAAGKDKTSSKQILAAKINGKVVIVDGNHRTALAYLQGKDTVRVKVYDAGTVKGLSSKNYETRLEANRSLYTRKLDDATDLAALLRKTTDSDAHQAATSPTNLRLQPTRAQRKAGNYKKGHVKISGLDISVENPEGSLRLPYKTPMSGHYGYVRGTLGADGDHLDCFVRPGTVPTYDGPVYIIDQKDPETGKFDEHKIMIGYESENAARRAYLYSYQPGWKGLGGITELSMAEFKTWLRSGNTKEPLAFGKISLMRLLRGEGLN